MRSVDSYKLPIMAVINHVLRCLNVACTLVVCFGDAKRTPRRRSQPCRIRKTLMIINCRIIQKALGNGISLNLLYFLLAIDIIYTLNVSIFNHK